jgi:hypothetical protein
MKVPFASILTVLLAGFLALYACKTDVNRPSDAAQRQLEAGIDTLTGQPVGKPNPWREKPCDLLTDAEVQTVFGFDPANSDYKVRTMPEGGYCLRKWNKADWQTREKNNENDKAPYLSPMSTVVLNVVDFGQDASAAEQFDQTKQVNKDAGGIEEVSGVGDGAFWNNNNTVLVFRKAHLIIYMTVDHADKAHDNLELAKGLAEMAIKKM